jgi:hypothetical protein
MRRQVEASQKFYPFAKDQFLGELLGFVRATAGVVAIDELDFDFLAAGALDSLSVDSLIGFYRLLKLRPPSSRMRP